MLGVEARKERGPGSGGRDPVFTGPPVGRGVNRQPDLDVSPLPEPARWLFIRPVLPPFISHYETQLLGIHRVETAQRPRPTGPLVSQPRHSCTPSSGWARSGPGSPVSPQSERAFWWIERCMDRWI